MDCHPKIFGSKNKNIGCFIQQISQNKIAAICWGTKLWQSGCEPPKFRAIQHSIACGNMQVSKFNNLVKLMLHES